MLHALYIILDNLNETNALDKLHSSILSYPIHSYPRLFQPCRHIHSHVTYLSSHFQRLRALGDIDLGVGRLDTAQLLSFITSEVVHGLETNVESTGGSVNSKNGDGLVNSIASVVQLVAFSAAGAATAGDGDGTANVREAWQLAECWVLSSKDTAAGDYVQGGAGDIVDCVVRDRDCLRSGCWDSSNEVERGQDGGAQSDERLHCGLYDIFSSVVIDVDFDGLRCIAKLAV